VILRFLDENADAEMLAIESSVEIGDATFTMVRSRHLPRSRRTMSIAHRPRSAAGPRSYSTAPVWTSSTTMESVRSSLAASTLCSLCKYFSQWNPTIVVSQILVGNSPCVKLRV
jgi:hypothetical protein